MHVVVMLLYGVCSLLLGALILFVLLWDRGHSPARWPLRRAFVFLSLSLLAWLATLFLEVHVQSEWLQLWLGRTNFAAVAFAAYFALRFTQELPPTPPPRRLHPAWPLAETWGLALLTQLTSLVAASEKVVAGHAQTTFGPLFPGYLAHVLAYLAAAAAQTLVVWRNAEQVRIRSQAALLGLGMLATGTIASITNALLPYGWDEFGYCDVGTLSTLLFTLAAAYATFFQGLFDLQLVVRKTVAYGLMLTFVLGAYSSAVFVLSQYLTTGAEKWVQFVVLFLAFSFDPLRRFVEERTDHLLFGEEKRKGRKGKGKALSLGLLFPWRRP